MWHLGTWFNGGLGSAVLRIELENLKGFSTLSDSVKLSTAWNFVVLEFYSHRIFKFCDSILFDWRRLLAPQRRPVRIMFSVPCSGCLREFGVADGVLPSLIEEIGLFVGGSKGRSPT